MKTLIAIGPKFRGAYTTADYKIEKRYWDVSDYKNAIYQMTIVLPNGQKKPSYGDVREKVFLKLIDENNIKVVANDSTLGIKHRSEFAEDMFDEYRELLNIYNGLDNQDKYIYPKEMADIMKFGLEAQIFYFKLGNDQILKNADSPNDSETQRVVSSNEQTIIRNFNIYLDQVNKESSFSPEAIAKYADGINIYFKQLTEVFPKADYSEMSSKAELMLKKTTSEQIKKALTGLISLLEQVKNKNNPSPASIPADSLKVS